MRLVFPLLLLMLLAGCGSEPAASPVASAADSVESGPGSEGVSQTVELTEEALRQAHITWQPVELRSIPQVLRAPGRIAMDENRVWRVGSLFEGRVVSMSANIEDTVKKGELLARLHSHDVHESRSEYTKARNDLATLKTRVAYLRTQAERMRRLYDLKAASEQQVQQAESELRDAEGLVQNAESEVERTRVHLEEFLGVEADHGEHTSDTDTYHSEDLIPILASGSGIVVERPVAPGMVVQPGTVLFVISDLSSVWMIVEMQQQHLGSIREGQQVTARVAAYPNERFVGRVTRVGSELNPETRTVQVRVVIPNSRLRLRPEMYADAEVAVGGSDEAMFIPQGAIQELQGQSVVFLKTGPTAFAVRAVETGEAMEGFRRIQAGLSAGDTVVVDGSFLLKAKLLEATLAEE